MNGWEGQVIAIAVKELLEALKTLTRDGFGSPGRDRALLSGVIRDLLSERPDIPRAEAALRQVESLATQPPADYYVARKLLSRVRRSHARKIRGHSLLSSEPGQSVAPRSGAGTPRRSRSSRPGVRTPGSSGSLLAGALRNPGRAGRTRDNS